MFGIDPYYQFVYDPLILLEDGWTSPQCVAGGTATQNSVYTVLESKQAERDREFRMLQLQMQK